MKLSASMVTKRASPILPLGVMRLTHNPEHPEFTLSTAKTSPEQLADQLLAQLGL